MISQLSLKKPGLLAYVCLGLMYWTVCDYLNASDLGPSIVTSRNREHTLELILLLFTNSKMAVKCWSVINAHTHSWSVYEHVTDIVHLNRVYTIIKLSVTIVASTTYADTTLKDSIASLSYDNLKSMSTRSFAWVNFELFALQSWEDQGRSLYIHLAVSWIQLIKLKG